MFLIPPKIGDGVTSFHPDLFRLHETACSNNSCHTHLRIGARQSASNFRTFQWPFFLCGPGPRPPAPAPAPTVPLTSLRFLQCPFTSVSVCAPRVPAHIWTRKARMWMRRRVILLFLPHFNSNQSLFHSDATKHECYTQYTVTIGD